MCQYLLFFFSQQGIFLTCVEIATKILLTNFESLWVITFSFDNEFFLLSKKVHHITVSILFKREKNIYDLRLE